jgi:hypothetical protein
MFSNRSGRSIPSPMSTKHVRTAADTVRFGSGLRVDCGACGASRTLDGFKVARTAGTGSLAAIVKRMRCSRCGAKDARFAVLGPPPGR